MRVAALIVEGALNIDPVAGLLGFVVLQDLTILILRDQAVEAVVDVVGAQGRGDAGALAVPLAGEPVGGVEMKALGVAACVVEVEKSRVQTPPFLLE